MASVSRSERLKAQLERSRALEPTPTPPSGTAGQGPGGPGGPGEAATPPSSTPSGTTSTPTISTATSPTSATPPSSTSATPVSSSPVTATPASDSASPGEVLESPSNTIARLMAERLKEILEAAANGRALLGDVGSDPVFRVLFNRYKKMVSSESPLAAVPTALAPFFAPLGISVQGGGSTGEPVSFLLTSAIIVQAKATLDRVSESKRAAQDARSGVQVAETRVKVLRADLASARATLKETQDEVAALRKALALMNAETQAAVAAESRAMQDVLHAAENKREAKAAKKRIRAQIKALTAASSSQALVDDIDGGKSALATSTEPARTDPPVVLTADKLREVRQLLDLEHIARSRAQVIGKLPSTSGNAHKKAQAKAEAMQAVFAVRSAREADPSAWDAAVAALERVSFDATGDEDRAAAATDASAPDNVAPAGMALSVPAPPSASKASPFAGLALEPVDFESAGTLVRLAPDVPFRHNHTLTAVQRGTGFSLPERLVDAFEPYAAPTLATFDDFAAAAVAGEPLDSLDVEIEPSLTGALLLTRYPSSGLLPLPASGRVRPTPVNADTAEDRLYVLGTNTSVVRLCLAIEYRKRQALKYVSQDPTLAAMHEICVSFHCLYTMYKAGAVAEDRLAAAAQVARSELRDIIATFPPCSADHTICHWHESTLCPCSSSARSLCRCWLPLAVSVEAPLELAELPTELFLAPLGEALAAARAAETGIARASKRVKLTTFDAAFSGAEGLDWARRFVAARIAERESPPPLSAAVADGWALLLAAGLVVPLSASASPALLGSSASSGSSSPRARASSAPTLGEAASGPGLVDSDKALYRFIMDDPKADLNLRVLFVGEPGSPHAVADKLKKACLSLYGAFLADDGRSLDREGMMSSEAFAAFEADIAELQRVDLAALGPDDRIAFFINVYNILCIHAQFVFGPPSSVLARRTFFKRARYTIALHSYSLDDIEHGILRCNVGGHFTDADDPRLALCPPRRDPRIHFALNCGAESCPPIRVYDADKLDAQLTLAAQCFCQSEVSIEPQPSASNELILSMSKIFMWYHNDFGATDADMLAYLMPFLPPHAAEIIAEALASDTTFKIEYNSYSWKAM
ncbi:uncharacterized protein AMSG_12075 [Thecamonas trahens ATCC 50062]|uniref:DUF547 domain-containing protein n=1 Tax=Thecamonas trahens ATCC 50062 TaxID=461836 RepID=A0A0L0DJW1_THETB|nr:hypothetical protein AMSG_12075 [Thecamonas trahens ATCC 50062]KNC51593.1 hypothetical protein AMSG_12075 [Thecamonas trahens ATCC 50062]|eukprot:XP_013756039.1 hypothetical protein AMSG_12075 [Thecamonas trahens ATCC 50062]